MKKPIIMGIHADKVDIVWPGVRPLIERALEYADGETHSDDVLCFIRERKMQLWAVFDGPAIIGASVTEIIKYTRKTSVRVAYLAGDNFTEWMAEFDDILAAWGREQKADSIEVVGRKGWGRKLVGLKYKERHVILRKEISHE